MLLSQKLNSLVSLITKSKKCLLFILLAFLIFFALRAVSNSLFYFFNFEKRDDQNDELGSLITSVIGVPNYVHPYYRNDSPDITRLSEAEWIKLVPKKRISKYMEDNMGKEYFTDDPTIDTSHKEWGAKSNPEYTSSLRLRVNSHLLWGKQHRFITGYVGIS